MTFKKSMFQSLYPSLILCTQRYKWPLHEPRKAVRISKLLHQWELAGPFHDYNIGVYHIQLISNMAGSLLTLRTGRSNYASWMNAPHLLAIVLFISAAQLVVLIPYTLAQQNGLL